MSDNSGILIIRHLRRVIQRPSVWLFIRKKASAVKQARSKRTPNSVCTSAFAVSPDPLTLAPQFQWLWRLQTT